MARNFFEESLGAVLATAVFAGVAGVAGSYALAGYTSSFVVAPIASFLTQVMPNAVLRFAIVTLTDVGQQVGIDHLGQQANLLLAITLGTALFASLTLAALATGRRFDSAFASVGLTGGLVWLAAAVLGAPVSALGAGVGSAVVVAVAVFAATAGETAGTSVSSRREVLGGLASALGVGVLGYVLGNRSTTTVATQPAASVDAGDAGGATGGTNRGDDSGTNAADDADTGTIQRYLRQAEQRSLDIEGLEGLVSGDDFYVVDIKNIDPAVDASNWTLSITGAVENEVEFTYEDLISMEREFQFATLRCVSDPLNGTKMDNDLWTGVPITRLLDEVNPQGNFVMLRSVDDYYEETGLETVRDGFMAYGKNGGSLPQEHGHPVRAVIGGHWGEISVKWIDELEILEQPQEGFWEKRGWIGTGPVNTVAKLHAVNHLDNGEIQVAGHTYAGARGIEQVEVSTNGGETWNEATLSARLPAGTDRPAEVEHAKNAWQQWEYTYEPPSGEHEVVVRATDGTGDLQPRDNKKSPYPSGAAGWVSKTVSP